ncbi:hypothetical protein [Pseudomonas baetica]|uniref:hypothetical protein n=1 Tax=Pseudomonas baetica TaxID=674054 RepID=UPI002870F8E3|nr:hypothetical protein [Pseudomonas baetica]MDR9865877.1 hypothetical protein [Pseudomonas baetica]
MDAWLIYARRIPHTLTPGFQNLRAVPRSAHGEPPQPPPAVCRYGLIHKLFGEVQLVGQADKVAGYEAFTLAYQRAVMGRLIDFNPFDIQQPVLVEHMALVYAKVMQEAGVRI